MLKFSTSHCRGVSCVCYGECKEWEVEHTMVGLPGVTVVCGAGVAEEMEMRAAMSIAAEVVVKRILKFLVLVVGKGIRLEN